MKQKRIKEMAEEFIASSNMSWENLEKNNDMNFYEEFLALKDHEKVFFLAYVQGSIYLLKRKR